MRKLLSAGALLFVLGVACLSKPAAAARVYAPCDCDYCATHLTEQCSDVLQRGSAPYLCSNYRSLFCP
jgi:hypothetical protein